MSLINRIGHNASTEHVGDTVLQAQEIYGAEFGVVVKLAWLYLEQNLLDTRLNIAFGRLLPATDFNTSPLYCNFMTLTICDHDRALSFSQGFEDWPMSVWGLRIRIWPTEHTYVMVGAYQSQPFPSGTENYTQGGHTGFNWTWRGTTGASIPIELAWLPSLGPERLLGHYKIGFNWDTSRYPDNYFDANGMPLVLSGLTGRPHEGRGQWWITGNQMLERNGPSPDDGLFVLATYAYDQSDTTLFRNFVWSGFRDRGFWAERPNDQVGFGFTYYDVSPRLAATEQLQAQLGLPLAGGARAVQGHGFVLEANYAVAPVRGVLLQPELEYFIRPGATNVVPNAFLVGLKVHVDF
jgi:porin